jgi:hypothetical protein
MYRALGDDGLLLQGEADVVEAVEQAVLAEGVHLRVCVWVYLRELVCDREQRKRESVRAR